MMNRFFITSLIGAMLGVVTVGTVCAAGNNLQAQPAAGSAQKVFLDPATGKMMTPAPEAMAAQTKDVPAESAQRAYIPYVAPDGTHMLAVSPGALPSDTFKLCPNGRIPRHAGADGKNELCSQGSSSKNAPETH